MRGEREERGTIVKIQLTDFATLLFDTFFQGNFIDEKIRNIFACYLSCFYELLTLFLANQNYLDQEPIL